MKLKIQINVGIIGKLETPYTDKQGNPQTSCSVNFEQDNGLVTGNLKVTKEFILCSKGAKIICSTQSTSKLSMAPILKSLVSTII